MLKAPGHFSRGSRSPSNGWAWGQDRGHRQMSSGELCWGWDEKLLLPACLLPVVRKVMAGPARVVCPLPNQPAQPGASVPVPSLAAGVKVPGCDPSSRGRVFPPACPLYRTLSKALRWRRIASLLQERKVLHQRQLGWSGRHLFQVMTWSLQANEQQSSAEWELPGVICIALFHMFSKTRANLSMGAPYFRLVSHQIKANR